MPLDVQSGFHTALWINGLYLEVASRENCASQEVYYFLPSSPTLQTSFGRLLQGFCIPCKIKDSNSLKGVFCLLSASLITAGIHAALWQLTAMVKDGWRTYRHSGLLLHHLISKFWQTSLEILWNNPQEKKLSRSQHHNRMKKLVRGLASPFVCLLSVPLLLFIIP